MPDSPHAREEYLAELERELPADRCREIVDEIAAHLDDAVAAGSTELEAQHRLGSPASLAEALARTEQHPVRLLAAAGAGLRAAVLHGVYGYVFGGFALFLAVMLVAQAVALGLWVVDVEWMLRIDSGWNSAGAGGAIAIGLYFAGRTVPDPVAVTLRRAVRHVRPWTTLVLAAASFVVLVAVAEVRHNAASVAVFTAAPVAVVLGAYRPGLLPRWIHLRIWTILLLFIAVGLLGWTASALGVGRSGGVASPPVPAPRDARGEVIGPWWTSDDGAPAVVSHGVAERDGVVRADWVVESAPLLASVTDIRAEAWASVGESSPEIDPVATDPILWAGVEVEGGQLGATLDLLRFRNIGQVEIVLTGVDRHGERRLLDGGTVLFLSFHGTVLDWLVAPTS